MANPSLAGGVHNDPYRGGSAVLLHAHLARVDLGRHARRLHADAGGDADLLGLGGWESCWDARRSGFPSLFQPSDWPTEASARQILGLRREARNEGIRARGAGDVHAIS